ncbi:MAG: hypothetical protein ACHQ51_10350 [Elusimicrobiota bacterium]
MKIIMLAMAILAPRASAAAHTVAIRFVMAQGSVSKTVKVEEGSRANFDGTVGGRRVIFVPVLSRADGGLRLDYQAELANGQSRTIQVQGAVGLRPGTSVMAVECGGWTVELAVDAAVGAKSDAKGAWSGGPMNNQRLTADVSTSAARRRCRQTLLLGSQTNIVDGGMSGDRKYGFILNVVTSASGASRNVQYQFENSPAGGKTVQGQGEVNLTPDHRSSSQGAGYKIDWLLEGAAPAAAAAVVPAAKAAPAPEASGAVPLLR